jgi:hypothetical protein
MTRRDALCEGSTPKSFANFACAGVFCEQFANALRAQQQGYRIVYEGSRFFNVFD